MYYERNSCAGFVAAVFASSEGARMVVAVEQFFCHVFVTVIDNGAVVAAQYYQGVFE